jgi:hypothetical protein
VLLCIKDLKGAGDAYRSLLKVNKDKCQSRCRKSSVHSYSISMDLKLLMPETINHLINSWDAIRDISDKP